jgi:prepilin signal peptidase PulO-like enzyme (type II secretory pathway)
VNDLALHLATALGLAAWTALVTFSSARAESHLGIDAPNRILRMTACVPIIVFASFVADGTTVLASAVACIAVTIAAFGDARTGYMFDAITFPAACLTAIVALASGDASTAAGGVASLVGTFGTLHVLSRGGAIGLGDVKAMYAIGAGFGPLAGLVAIFAASMSGIAAAIASTVRTGRRPTEIRFGPHLAFGTSFALVAARAIVHGLGV